MPEVSDYLRIECEYCGYDESVAVYGDVKDFVKKLIRRPCPQCGEATVGWVNWGEGKRGQK